MRIKDIPENTSYYTVSHAFRRDNVGRLWISNEYEASPRPNGSRFVEIIRTPDNRYHIKKGALAKTQIDHAAGVANLVPCWEDSKRKVKVQNPPETAEKPGFRYL